MSAKNAGEKKRAEKKQMANRTTHGKLNNNKLKQQHPNKDENQRRLDSHTCLINA